MKESKINSDSYIVVQGWMITELNLKGNELLVFAIIHGFSQDNAGEFTGSLQYLADWTNSSKRWCIKSLQSLCDKGLLIKKELWLEGVKYCTYKVNAARSGEQNSSHSEQNSSGVMNKVHGGGEQNDTRGDEQSSPNKLLYNNLDDNIDIYIVEIVSYLNEKSGKSFSSEIASTRKHIIARLKEGRSVDDFKKVINTKCSQWLNTNMSMYLRPSTLFGPSNFENYLNEGIGGANNGSNADIGVDKSVFGARG
jgi:uncharacterized phage protein (TIGR02220 family)